MVIIVWRGMNIYQGVMFSINSEYNKAVGTYWLQQIVLD